jgi:hypothetical protein
MKKKQGLFFGFAVLLASALLVFAGCGNAEGGPAGSGDDPTGGGPIGGGNSDLSGAIVINPSGSVSTGTLLTAVYGGTESVSYQWNKDGSAISGKTSSTYTPATVGIYTVTVSAAGFYNKTSDPVTVNTLPNLTGTVNITPNGNVTPNTLLTAVYGGTESVSYQWNKNGSAIPGETNTSYTPTTVGSYTVTVSAADFNSTTSTAVTVVRPAASIKTTFNISTAGTQGVTDTFGAVHTYLQSKSAAAVASEGLIQLGDYIDLPGMTVTYTANDAELSGHGRLFRLIVVGINSFNEGQGGSYTGNGNGTAAHLVFQFQNLPPFTHRMNAYIVNADVYAQSEMRTWLTTDFLQGLVGAGVPDSVLWAPKRFVANGGSATAADLIEDKLWLPTEWELFGSNTFSVTAYENASNQARLEYYTDNSTRIKYISSNVALDYWEASPRYNSSYFSCVDAFGNNSSGRVPWDSGSVAPAFCVK